MLKVLITSQICDWRLILSLRDTTVFKHLLHCLGVMMRELAVFLQQNYVKSSWSI